MFAAWPLIEADRRLRSARRVSQYLVDNPSVAVSCGQAPGAGAWRQRIALELKHRCGLGAEEVTISVRMLSKLRCEATIRARAPVRSPFLTEAWSLEREWVTAPE